MTGEMRTIRIRIPDAAGFGPRLRRVLRDYKISPHERVRLEVSTPRALSKDNAYRLGAEYVNIDIAPYRLYGWIDRELKQLEADRCDDTDYQR